jgi:4-hydroxybenzoate polyprenyltransferase
MINYPNNTLRKESITGKEQRVRRSFVIRYILFILVYLKNLMEMIKVEHTIFSLPFVLLSAMLAARGLPAIDKLLWIIAAVATARTAAMTFNRLVDQEFDSNNPRTKDRALPTGQVGQISAICLLFISIILFMYAAEKLGTLPYRLAIPTLLVILSYSLCKRFTLLSHIILGLSLAIAPLGASIAINGNIDPPIWFLAIGVLTWTTGFDIIYALQDVVFDKKYKLYSVPACVGVTAALWISRGMHLMASGAWAVFNYKVGSGFMAWVAWIVVTIILVREQWIVRKGRLEQINQAFFTLNSMVGIFFFLGHAIEWTLIKLDLKFLWK